MAKKDDNKIFWIAGAALLGWMLAPEDIKDKVKEYIPIPSGGDIDFGNIFGGLFEGLQFPEFPEIWPFLDGGGVQWPDWIPDLFPDGDGSPWPEFPDLVPDITLPPYTPVRDFISRNLALGARQYAGLAFTGHRIIRPMPLAGAIKEATAPFRKAVSKIAGKPIGKIAPRVVSEMPVGAYEAYFKAAKKGIRIIPRASSLLDMRAAELALEKASGKGIGKGFGYAATKGLGRIAPKAGLGFAKVGARAIPVVGWALTLVDVGADIARLFGANVTEWLGFSGLISAFTGENPLEKWAAQGIAMEQEQSFYNPSVSSETGAGWSVPLGMLASSPAKALEYIEGGEKPHFTESQLTHTIEPYDWQVSEDYEITELYEVGW